MEIIQAALFGSVARGTSDQSSDLDVICILEAVEGVDLGKIRQVIGSYVGPSPSVSFYTRNRISQLYDSGGPFAWHLYLEAQEINGLPCDFLRGLGAPSKYETALDDSLRLSEILNSIEPRLDSRAVSLCYEAGLIYVCMRNIGIFSSFSIAPKVAFDRYAPYALYKNFRLDISKSDYDLLVRCRHASARGSDPPEISKEWLRAVLTEAINWTSKVSRGLLNGK